MTSEILKLALIGSAALALAAPLALATDSLGDAGIGSSSSPDAHEESSESLDSHHATSGKIGNHEETSENIDAHETGSENPDDLDAGPENIADHESGSVGLQDLGNADQQDAAVERTTLKEVEASQPSAAPAHRAESTSSHRMSSQLANVHAAKQQVIAAKKRAATADDAYSQMMETDYPRGEARLKIVDERKLAHESLERAERNYDAALNGGGPASP